MNSNKINRESWWKRVLVQLAECLGKSTTMKKNGKIIGFVIQRGGYVSVMLCINDDEEEGPA
jgi:hypothetical protein